ncbi:MAG: hypothetical protein CBE41_02510 [Gammaproteobacteria bacterium TMED281]|nr:MAG: hypothetical protein CBE41_02510 [Gammaproteobacteria bacterium TMED281]
MDRAEKQRLLLQLDGRKSQSFQLLDAVVLNPASQLTSNKENAYWAIKSVYDIALNLKEVAKDYIEHTYHGKPPLTLEEKEKIQNNFRFDVMRVLNSKPSRSYSNHLMVSPFEMKRCNLILKPFNKTAQGLSNKQILQILQIALERDEKYTLSIEESIHLEWKGYLCEYFKRLKAISNHISVDNTVISTLRGVLNGLTGLSQQIEHASLSLSSKVDIENQHEALSEIRQIIKRLEDAQKTLKDNKSKEIYKSSHFQLTKQYINPVFTKKTDRFIEGMLKNMGIQLSDDKIINAKHSLAFVSEFLKQNNMENGCAEIKNLLADYQASGDLRHFDLGVLHYYIKQNHHDGFVSQQIDEYHKNQSVNNMLNTLVNPLSTEECNKAIRQLSNPFNMSPSIDVKKVQKWLSDDNDLFKLFKRTLTTLNRHCPDKNSMEEKLIYFLCLIKGSSLHAMSEKTLKESLLQVKRLVESRQYNDLMSTCQSEEYSDNVYANIFRKMTPDSVSFRTFISLASKSTIGHLDLEASIKFKESMMYLILIMPNNLSNREQTKYWSHVGKALGFKDIESYRGMFDQVKNKMVKELPSQCDQGISQLNQLLLEEKATLSQPVKEVTSKSFDLPHMKANNLHKKLNQLKLALGFHQDHEIHANDLEEWLVLENLQHSQRGSAYHTQFDRFSVLDSESTSLESQISSALAFYGDKARTLEDNIQKGQLLLDEVKEMHNVLDKVFTVFTNEVSITSSNELDSYITSFEPSLYSKNHDYIVNKLLESKSLSHHKKSLKEFVQLVQMLEGLKIKYENMDKEEILDCIEYGVNKQNQTEFKKSIESMASKGHFFKSTSTKNRLIEIVEEYFNIIKLDDRSIIGALSANIPAHEMKSMRSDIQHDGVTDKNEMIVKYLKAYPNERKNLIERYLVRSDVVSQIQHLKGLAIDRASTGEASFYFKMFNTSPYLFYQCMSCFVENEKELHFLGKLYAPKLFNTKFSTNEHDTNENFKAFMAYCLNGFKLKTIKDYRPVVYLFAAITAFLFSIFNPAYFIFGVFFLAYAILFYKKSHQLRHFSASKLQDDKINENHSFIALDLMIYSSWDERLQLDIFLQMLNEVVSEDNVTSLLKLAPICYHPSSMDEALFAVGAVGGSREERLSSLNDVQRIQMFQRLGKISPNSFLVDLVHCYQKMKLEGQNELISEFLVKKFSSLSVEDVNESMKENAPFVHAYDMHHGLSNDLPLQVTASGPRASNETLDIYCHLKCAQKIEKQLLTLDEAGHLEVPIDFQFKGIDQLSAMDLKALQSARNIDKLLNLTGDRGSMFNDLTFKRELASQVLNDYKANLKIEPTTNSVSSLGLFAKQMVTEQSNLPWYFNNQSSRLFSPV